MQARVLLAELRRFECCWQGCGLRMFESCSEQVLMGAVLFAAVQGSICGVVTNGDPDETRWKQNNLASSLLHPTI